MIIVGSIGLSSRLDLFHLQMPDAIEQIVRSITNGNIAVLTFAHLLK